MEMAAMPPCLFTTPPRSSHITKRKWNAMRNGADETSRLAKRLCLDVVWGHMPAYRAQQYAHDALEVGAKPVPLLKKIGKLGRGGEQPSICWQDMRKLMPTSFANTVLSYVPIPFKSEEDPGDLQMALPHAFFSAAYHKNKGRFANVMFKSQQENMSKF